MNLYLADSQVTGLTTNKNSKHIGIKKLVHKRYRDMAFRYGQNLQRIWAKVFSLKRWYMIHDTECRRLIRLLEPIRAFITGSTLCIAPLCSVSELLFSAKARRPVLIEIQFSQKIRSICAMPAQRNPALFWRATKTYAGEGPFFPFVQNAKWQCLARVAFDD